MGSRDPHGTGGRPAAGGRVSPARVCACAVVRRVFEQGAYADRALHAEAADLPARERALATALAYSVVQRRATLDHVIERLARRPQRLEASVLAVLRLGLAQLLLLDGIPEHAAVDQSVELVRQTGRPSAAGLVNAVLRRGIGEGPGILAELSDETPEQAAILRSVPEWLARMWWRELGAEGARALLRAINAPPESGLRVNTLAATIDEVLPALPGARPAGPDLPEGLVIEGPFDAHGSPLFERGAIMPQSRGSMLVARLLDPVPGERVLDLCAAPGAKTSHLAALIEGRGEVWAVERHPGRAEALRRTLRRMRADHVARVEVGDASEPGVAPCSFDRVLVDPPCSGLGTLQSRPDLRWRAAPEQIAELAVLQGRILRAGAAALGPGGTLVYSVCTISRAEGAEVVDAFLAAHDGWELELDRQLRPDTDRTDGFFIARLRRR